jgi:threonyl-tRNA synthetase
LVTLPYTALFRSGAVSFRYRDGRQDNGVPVEEAIERVASAVASREQV